MKIAMVISGRQIIVYITLDLAMKYDTILQQYDLKCVIVIIL